MKDILVHLGTAIALVVASFVLFCGLQLAAPGARGFVIFNAVLAAFGVSVVAAAIYVAPRRALFVVPWFATGLVCYAAAATVIVGIKRVTGANVLQRHPVTALVVALVWFLSWLALGAASRWLTDRWLSWRDAAFARIEPGADP